MAQDLNQLVNVLGNINNINNQIRLAAEQHIAIASQQQGFGLALATLLVKVEVPEQIRQLAGLLLKKFVKEHWSNLSEHFSGPQCSEQEKLEIKNTLPNALADGSNKVRTSVAMAISSIAAWDWPEKWPGLVENLVNCLQHDNLALVSGAMKTLDLFASGDNLTDQHVPLLVNYAFPQILRIFADKQKYPDRIRFRAVRILYSLVNWMGTIHRMHKTETINFLAPVLPHWLQLFKDELARPDSFEQSSAIKISILQIMSVMITEFPAYIGDALPVLIQPIWSSYVGAVQIWEKVAIHSETEDDSGYDSDGGDQLSFEAYVCMLIEVLTCIAERNRFRPLLQNALAEVFVVTMSLLQLTEAQVDTYSHDPNTYMADEDDETFAFCPRIACCAFLQQLIEGYFLSGVAALQVATQQRLQFAEQAKQANHPFWWKIRESVVYAVGTSFNAFNKAYQDRILYEDINIGQLPFDINGFVTKILVPDCQPQENVFLRGRSLWAASCLFQVEQQDPFGMGSVAPNPLGSPGLEVLKIFLVNAANSIQQQNAPLPLKLFACRAFATLAPQLPKDLLGTAVAGVLPVLVSMLKHLTEETLHLLLETISLIIPMDPVETAKNAPFIIDELHKAWYQHHSDPLVSTLIQENFKELSKLNGCVNELQTRLTPTLISVLNQPDSNMPGVAETAADIVTCLVMRATWPLPAPIINELFPLLVQRILTTQDHGLMQSGCSALVGFVRCAKENLLQWRTNDTNGVDLIVKVIARMLDPNIDDSAALYVGSLISKTLDTVGNALGQNVAAILNAICVRLVSKDCMASLSQSLLLVFMKLLRSNSQQTLQFLAGLTLPNQQNALQYLLSIWTKGHEDFHGSYQIRMSIATLATLFTESQLDKISVPGDLANLSSPVRMTRSKGKSDQRGFEPFKVRVFKILVREHMVCIEDKKAPALFESDEDDDDNGDGEGGGGMGSFAYPEDLDDILGEDIVDDAYDDDEVDTDPDVINDPIFKLNLQGFIEDFLKQFANQNADGFQMFFNTLSPDEKNHVKTYVFKQTQ